jgi:hypothetical protein
MLAEMEYGTQQPYNIEDIKNLRNGNYERNVIKFVKVYSKGVI